MNMVKGCTVLPLEDNQAFFDEVDWEPLLNFVESEYGINKDTFCAELDIPNGQTFFLVWKEDVSNKCGVICHGLKEAHLESFRSDIRCPVTYDYDLLQKAIDQSIPNITYEMLNGEYGELELYFTASIHYHLFNGRSNGIHIFSAKYTLSENWIISTAEGKELTLRQENARDDD